MTSIILSPQPFANHIGRWGECPIKPGHGKCAWYFDSGCQVNYTQQYCIFQPGLIGICRYLLPKFNLGSEQTEGPPSTEVTATGSGWPAGHQVSVQWEDGTELTTIMVDANGGFTVSFTVPDSATEGQHTVYFYDVLPEGGSGYSIPVTFTVAAPTAGPFDGQLVSDGNAQLGFYSARVKALDFDAEVRLFNPYPTNRGSWFYGFSFRDLGDTYYVVLIGSYGGWQHNMISRGEVQALDQGTSNAIDTSEGGSNRLKLIVRGNRGWFHINNQQLATTLDLSHLRQPVDVGVIVQTSLRGETQLEGFTVWGK